MVRLGVGLAVLLTVGSVAAAEDDEATKLSRAVNNFQQEITTCMAYYTVMKICLGAQAPDLGNKIDAAVEGLTEMAANMGQTLGMTTDAMMSRFKIEEHEMRTLTDSNCVNMASLDERHALRCGQLLKDANSVLNEWLEREGLPAQ